MMAVVATRLYGSTAEADGHGTGRGGEAAVERDSEDFTDQGFFSLGNGCLLSFHLCELVLDSLLQWLPSHTCSR